MRSQPGLTSGGGGGGGGRGGGVVGKTVDLGEKISFPPVSAQFWKNYKIGPEKSLTAC